MEVREGQDAWIRLLANLHRSQRQERGGRNVQEDGSERRGEELHRGRRDRFGYRDFQEGRRTEVMGKQEVPGQGWSFIGADPEGNVIALWEQMKPARRAGRRRKSKRRQAHRSFRRGNSERAQKPNASARLPTK